MKLVSLLGVRRCSTSSNASFGWTHLPAKAAQITQALRQSGQTVAVAETSSGGLISAALFSSFEGQHVFRGAGVRLPSGISDSAGQDAKAASQNQLLAWGIEYANKIDASHVGTVVHALELAHAAKLNLGTDWGIGESGVPGPDAHPRTGYPAGMGFVAVVGPTSSRTGVLKLDPVGETGRADNMCRFAIAALDLMSHIQTSAGAE